MGRRRRGGKHRNQPQTPGPRRQPPPRPTNAASADAGAAPTPPDETAAQPRRLAARTCGWCGGRITVKATGRLPKWCSQSCRQRAWEQSRAAAAGLSAVRVIERRAEVSTPAVARRQDWPRLLGDLARQLDDGRVYDRELLAPSTALSAVLDAYGRRPYVRRAADSGERLTSRGDTTQLG
jgi:hypothetical protein